MGLLYGYVVVICVDVLYFGDYNVLVHHNDTSQGIQWYRVLEEHDREWPQLRWRGSKSLVVFLSSAASAYSDFCPLFEDLGITLSRYVR
jgi:hypothetical protein